MASVFTKIAQGEIPCHKIAETEDFLAFLDVNPLTEGHVLAVPKKEVDYLFDLPDPLYMGLMAFSREVARALDQAIDCQRVAVLVLGLEVPHAHLHLVPIQSEKDLDLGKERGAPDHEKLAAVAAKIRKKIPGNKD